MLKDSQRIRNSFGGRWKDEPATPARKSHFWKPGMSITLRRHSVLAHNGVNINVLAQRSSSKDLKSLQKYKSSYRPEADVRRSYDKLPYSSKFTAKKDTDMSYLHKSDYRYVNMVGKGGFGRVWKVEHRGSLRVFALKQMSKAIVLTKRSVQSILNERQLLSTLRHRFIVNMLYAFQDNQSLYIVMNLMQGGDLRYHLSKMIKFTQLQTKFMVASVLLALEYLHSRMIIHRDVKPENIVFDRRGFAYLTDLGIAKHLRVGNSEDTSGTPGYMAPEVMFHHDHRYEVDYFAIGIVVYEIMIGRRPYQGKNRQQIKQGIKQKQASIAKREIPDGWSIQSADFVNKLIQRRPMNRLGWAGFHQVKQHMWLRGFPWQQLLQGRLESPMRRYYNFQEVRYRITENDTSYDKMLEKNAQMLSKGSMQEYFEGYTYGDHTVGETTVENTRAC